MAGKNIIEIKSKEDFEKQVTEKSNVMPVIVDFWATWCGPCQMFGPIFEKVAAEFAGKVSFVKVSVETSHDIAQEYEVMSIPTIKIFKNGKVVDTFMGVVPENALKEFVKRSL